MANFNSTFWSTVEPFALKAEKGKWYLAVPDKLHHPQSYATWLDYQKKWEKKNFLANFGLVDIFGCREAHKSIEVAHSSRLPWCRDCSERLGYRHICHCEWMNSEFTRKQSPLASLSSRAKGHWGWKWCTSKKKKNIDGKKGNSYEKCLYSYANKELKSCDPSCRG